MIGLLKALINSLHALLTEHTVNGERSETADPARHDDMQCRHCGHVHAEADGSCICGCTLPEI